MRLHGEGLTRRGALRLGLLAGGGALLGGCSEGGSRDEITVMTLAGEFDEETRRAAERALGLRIRRIDPDLTRLTAMLAAGDPPDVVRAAGALEVPFLVAREMALDLDDHFAASDVLRADDLDPVNDVWRFDGAVQGRGPRYGMAKDYSQDGMFWYDAELFEKAGVDLPDTSRPLGGDEWLDLARRLTVRKNGRTEVHGLDVSSLNPFVQFQGLTTAAGGALFSDDLASVDFSSPEALGVLRWYLDYIEAGVGFSPVSPGPDGWAWPPFQARRMAMVMAGYWFGGLIVDDPGLAEASRFAPAPLFGPERISPSYATIGYWIPRKSRNPDAAWAFFEWYLGGPPAQERAATGFGLPALRSLRSRLPRELPFQKQVLEVQEAEDPYFSTLSFTPYARVDALDGVINRVLPAAYEQGRSAGQTADLLNEEVNEVLKRGRELVG